MGKSPRHGGRRPPAQRRGAHRWPWLLGIAVLFVLLATIGRGAITQSLVRTHVAETGRIENTLSVRGHLVWKEKLLTAPMTGTLSMLTDEGERVRAGAVLFEIHNPQTQAAIKRQIDVAEQRLMDFRCQATEQSPLLLAGLEQATNDLLQAVNVSRQLLGSTVIAQQQLLVQLYAHRAEQRMALSQLEAEEAALSAQLSAVQAQQADAIQQVLAPMPGVAVHTVDRLEDTLHWEQMSRLTPRVLFTLAPAPFTMKSGDSVVAGDPVLKLVDMAQTALAVATEEAKVQDLMLGMRVGVRLENGSQLSAKVTDLHYGSPPGYALVLLSINEGVELLGCERSLELVLVKTASEGIRIPQSALFEQAGQMGVYAVYKTMVRFQPVEIVVTSGHWALVLGLAAGDEVITTPRWVTDGQRVN